MYTEFIKNVFLKKWVLTILTLLCLVSFSFLGYHLLRSNLYVLNNQRNLQTLVKKQVYVGNDQTSDAQIKKSFAGKSATKADAHARQVLNYLDQNYHYALRWSFDGNLANGRDVSIDTVNANFFTFYLISVASGRTFNARDYTSSSSEIPVLIGAKLAKSHPLGSKFSIVNTSSGKKEWYKVVGVMAANASVPSVYLLDNQTYLNNSIIRPFRKADRKNLTATQLMSAMQDLIVYDTSQAQLTKLTQKFNQGSFFKIRFISAKKNMADFYTNYKGTAIMFALISLIILAIATGIIIWNTWSCLKEEQSEIALRISLGLLPKNMLIAAIIYQVLISLVAVIPVTVYAVTYTKTLAQTAVGISSQIVLSGLLPKAEATSLVSIFALMLVITVFAVILVTSRFSKQSLAFRMGEE
ncbi:MAG: ABC transporter permease [Lactobacillus equicursoris]|uniref:ABC transporter permease n=1 Tax=Lactobacillus equicursoris TaxID=420645 RepID=UPI00242B2A9C|nr:ABC transporter permease [Lactobacillus equicursoris]MDD6385988.1 ABC transporter permease [Lactobacillus equicursoris]MDD6407193.1 ABC transporter permease [Lactobacillus equicursoris]